MSQQPEFLNRTLLPSGTGFHLAATPSMDLLDSQALEDENQWIVLAAALERTKQGDFKELKRLIRCIRKDNDLALWNACSVLLGYASSTVILEYILESFHKEIYQSRNLFVTDYVLRILQCSMGLWTIPIMLKIYLSASDHERGDPEAIGSDEPSLASVPVYISALLEDEHGPIYDADLTDSQYEKLVIQHYERLYREKNSDKVAVANGRLFSLRQIVLRLLRHLRTINEEVDMGVDKLEIVDLSLLFEASTGVDCRSFYRDYRLQPLAATAILEDFIESGEADKYQDGVRYFFGRRIPDQV